MQGFELDDAKQKAIMAAAEDLLEGQIFADANYSPEQNLDMLVRLVRLLQVNSDLQLLRNQELTEDLGELQEEFAVR